MHFLLSFSLRLISEGVLHIDMCVYVYTHIHTYIYVYTHTYVYVCIIRNNSMNDSIYIPEDFSCLVSTEHLTFCDVHRKGVCECACTHTRVGAWER